MEAHSSLSSHVIWDRDSSESVSDIPKFSEHENVCERLHDRSCLSSICQISWENGAVGELAQGARVSHHACLNKTWPGMSFVVYPMIAVCQQPDSSPKSWSSCITAVQSGTGFAS